MIWKIFASWAICTPLCFLLCSEDIFAKAEVACETNAFGSTLALASKKGRPVFLQDRIDTCAAGFEFLESCPDSATGLLLLPPKELGLNSQRSVSAISFESGNITPIGEIPSSSEVISYGVFEDTVQQGGSIYRTRYYVDSGKILVDSNSLELVLTGYVCTKSDVDSQAIEMPPESGCKNVTAANFTNPICIVHEGASSRVAAKSFCEKLGIHP
jgi:hypothetical protein